MNPRKLGNYYFIKREQKELLNSYGNFYDTLELTAFPEKKISAGCCAYFFSIIK